MFKRGKKTQQKNVAKLYKMIPQKINKSRRTDNISFMDEADSETKK